MPPLPIPYPEHFRESDFFISSDSLELFTEELQTSRTLASLHRKPTVPEVLPLVRALYREHAAGGFLHIVLDDGNIDDCYVESCANLAAFNGDEFTLNLAMALRKMSLAQRRKVRASR